MAISGAGTVNEQPDPGVAAMTGSPVSVTAD
jgi:hypothetical protein